MIETQTVSFALDDKYRREEGTILLSGVQALARVPLDQHRADKRRGVNTATLISGYRGSPLGGLDLLLQKEEKLFKEHQVVFIPGVNEDLGATAIFGSQMANLFPKPKYDGVLGIWYGKGPGVDRTGDVFKHANLAGVGRNGGVLALAGDDPLAKSSTIPSHSEVALFDALLPVLYPGSIQDILDFGRLGFELSRYSGLWVGFKVVTNVADGFGSAEVSPNRIVLADPGFTLNGKPWQATQNPNLITPLTLAMEQEMYEGRLEAAKAFAAANGINRITVPTPDAWLGIVAAGKTYYDLRQALQQLGLDDTALARYGIRLLKVGMLFPLEPGIVKEFARGLQEVFVIEEKRAFVELFLRDILYNLSERPTVVGKRDEQGQTLVQPYGELDADKIAELLVKRLERRLPPEAFAARQAQAATVAKRPLVQLPMAASRHAYFCSGCPHNTSTVVPDGSMAGAGIGCSTMAVLMNRNTLGVTQMGGEGAQWVGMSPFSDTPHMFQNIGDGTLFHSGTLAIRQAIAANTNITYKILYNSAVAMTGGQEVDGGIPVPELTHLLMAEGVQRILITADDPDKYPQDTRWPEGVEVWHRDRLDEAQRALREVKGVSVLIYDQMCAAEKRRQRKRGKLADPPMRVFINEAVCEGCGDCGAKSNCLSVQPVETEFGRKTQIHQSSCNKDYSCVKGDCPSFLEVIPRAKPAKAKRKLYRVEDANKLPEPALKVGTDCNIFMAGIGGTGVVTINQILGTAALLEGKHINALDQTGLSQKGGPVTSHLKISAQPVAASNKLGVGEADAYLGFDILTTVQNLSFAKPDRTFAVVSTGKVPTGSMVTSTEAAFPDSAGLEATINRTTRAEDNVYFDALHLSETFFGDHMPANLIVVGAALQAGLIPLSAASIEKAIQLNGASVEKNLEAFRLGRKVVVQPEWASSLKPQRAGAVEVKPALSGTARKLVDEVGASGELLQLLEVRVPELIAYQNAGYARQYVELVKQVVKAERARTPGQTELSEAVARYLFKLMAYKDEYEVARLHIRPEARKAVEEAFGKGAQVQYLLHPPMLRAMGLKNKIKLGKWFDPAFVVLANMKRVRGTPLDVFGYAKVRKVERELIGEYRQLVEGLLKNLSEANHEKAVKLASLPDLIRGYEDLKLKNVARFREQVKLLSLETVATEKEAAAIR